MQVYWALRNTMMPIAQCHFDQKVIGIDGIAIFKVGDRDA
jgi:hypothetical protein